MSIELSAVFCKTERRLILTFTNTLAAAAFGVAPIYYVFTALSVEAAPIYAKAALVIPSAPNQVEIALSDDMLPGARYTITAIGVPAADTSVSTSASTQVFSHRNANRPVNVEPEATQDGSALFGIDLVWTGEDFLQNASGDLAVVVGATNALGALGRRVMSDGLPYDPSYGGRPREFIDAPTSTVGTLRGRILAQLTADPRVVQADVSFLPDAVTPTEVTFTPMVKLIGDSQPRPLSVSVTRG